MELLTCGLSTPRAIVPDRGNTVRGGEELEKSYKQAEPERTEIQLEELISNVWLENVSNQKYKSLMYCAVVVVRLSKVDKMRSLWGERGAAERWERISNPAGLHPGLYPEVWEIRLCLPAPHRNTQHAETWKWSLSTVQGHVTSVNLVNAVQFLLYTRVRNSVVPCWTTLCNVWICHSSTWDFQAGAPPSFTASRMSVSLFKLGIYLL